MNRTSVRRALSTYLEAPAARFLARLGLSPNALTLLGLAGAGGSAFLLSTGHLLAGGIVFLASAVLDLFDGALARATDRVSSVGALLDSVADRVSEMVVLLGLLLFYLHRSSMEGVLLVYLALGGSVMVSYLRARAEGLRVDCRVGVMTRPERVGVLGIGLLVGHWWLTGVAVALGIVAGLAFLTSIQRLIHVMRAVDGPSR